MCQPHKYSFHTPEKYSKNYLGLQIGLAKYVTSSQIKLGDFSKFLWSKDIRTLTKLRSNIPRHFVRIENQVAMIFGGKVPISGFQTPGSDNE